jgi:PPOX class probable F420-dependent enzyme
MISNREKYINLATRKRDGSFVDTPVWFAQFGDEPVFFVFSLKDAGKVKRIRNFSEVRVVHCTFRGGLKGEWQDACAELVTDPKLVADAHVYFRKKYGWVMRLSDFFSRLVGNFRRRQYIRLSFDGRGQGEQDVY